MKNNHMNLKNTQRKNHPGFSLTAVIFIITVLTLIGTYMLRLVATSNSTTLYGMQGIRAYYAARSGLEWGSRTVVNNCGGVSCTTGCTGANPVNTTLTLTQGGVNGFSVAMVCTAVSVTTDGVAYTMYTLTATASRGTLGSGNYTARTLVQMITN